MERPVLAGLRLRDRLRPRVGPPTSAAPGTSSTCDRPGRLRRGPENRYLTGIAVDPADQRHAYISVSGYARHWMVGPDDPGVGHVFQTTDGGSGSASASRTRSSPT
ncbi:MAG TPA: hypothetical protein VFK62_01165 [Gaiellaceae bacterium]|nr:hypothetical protein [Gaiellaceae bacterium]